MQDDIPPTPAVKRMHGAAGVPMESAQRGAWGEEVEDGGAGRARCVVPVWGMRVRVWDAEGVAVCFDEVAAFDVWLEVEGGYGGLDGGGLVFFLGLVGGVDWFYLRKGGVHFR